MKRKIIFETQRLIVREWQSEDEAELKKFLQDENVMYDYDHAFSDEEVANWLKWNLQSYQEYGYGLWALEKKRTGEVIGECGLTNQLVKGKSYPEIGYHLCGKEWHKGYAIEAAAATKQYAFDVLNFPEVISTIRDTNLASMNVAIRNQMLVRDRYIKTYRGKTMPHYVFSVKNQKNKD